jgi:thioredoxin 1
MSQVPQISEQAFQTEVMRSAVPVLVDFHATWCQPCKQLAPVLDELAKHYGGRIKIVKMDTDEAQDTAVRLGIMSVPTLVLFKKGQEAYRRAGGASKTALVTELDQVL